MRRRLPIVCGVALLLAIAGCGGGDEARGAELVVAAGRGDEATVRRLIDDGVNVDARDDRGRTAVTAAAAARHADVVRLLVGVGADVDIQDAERNNALLVSGETGDAGVLREVLRARPDLGRTNRYGGTALIPASDRGHVEAVRELLRTDIDVDHVNNLGWTALLEAVILGEGGPTHQEIVRLLVDAGADTGNADREGVTALEHARQRGYGEIARTIEQGQRGRS